MDNQLSTVNNQNPPKSFDINIYKQNKLIFLFNCILDAISFLFKYLILSLTFFYFNISKSVIAGFVILILTLHQLEITYPIFMFILELILDFIKNWLLQFETIILLIAYFSRTYQNFLEVITLASNFFFETFIYITGFLSQNYQKLIVFFGHCIQILNETTQFLYLNLLLLISFLFFIFPYLLSMIIFSISIFYCHKKRESIIPVFCCALVNIKICNCLFIEKLSCVISFLLLNTKRVFVLIASIINYIYDSDEINNEIGITETVILPEITNEIDTKNKQQKIKSLKKKRVSINLIPCVSYYNDDDEDYDQNQDVKKRKVYNKIYEFETLEQAKHRLEFPLDQFRFRLR
jgi:hypothetical protein